MRVSVIGKTIKCFPEHRILPSQNIESPYSVMASSGMGKIETIRNLKSKATENTGLPRLSRT